jgi:hypothetical protein
VTDGDDRVNAKDGLDDTATAIAAPVMAARTPLVIRRGIMVSSRLAQRLEVFAFAAEPGLNAVSLRLFCCFIKKVVPDFRPGSASWVP